MRNKNKKIIPRFYTVADIEKEEKFLNKMSLSGWHFYKGDGFLYHFIRGEEKNYYYRMDFVYNSKVDDDYKQMFLDAGWEILYKSQKLILFRTDFALNKNIEIYTDIPTRLTELKKISNYALTCLLIPIISTIYIGYEIFRNQYKTSMGIIAAIIAIFLITGYPNVKIRRGIAKLESRLR